MPKAQEYVLGQTASAARRLEIQDAHFAEPSELLLDDLAIRPDDRVVELGCGPGSFSHRILRRLGAGGILVGVDSSSNLLAQATQRVGKLGPAHFEPVVADISQLGAWLSGATVVVGRAVLHHVPMAELLVGRLRAALPPGTRVGFLEPDFRSPLARIAWLEATGHPELEPLRVWGLAINQLYQANRLSPDVGATLARTMELAGYHELRTGWNECRSDEMMIENMLMVYDEIREWLATLNILSAAEVERQQTLLRTLEPKSLPAAWANFRAAAKS
jgi:ubiquinone/menaquinone biosynthesis C-methylase UbiE